MNERDRVPGVGAQEAVVLFDAVCKLCSGWARFLIRHDTARRFRLATVQSPEGKAILQWCGLPTEAYDTLVLVEGDRFYVRSAAVIRVLARLPPPWKLGVVAWLLPRPLRDWAYDKVARNRYRLFGKYDACVVPTPDHLARFLEKGS
jgi:predicted DCC family thiol-disulfide oxidoreductase YuxK